MPLHQLKIMPIIIQKKVFMNKYKYIQSLFTQVHIDCASQVLTLMNVFCS